MSRQAPAGRAGALYPQTVIAFVWDSDKTLTPGYMQDPLFAAYGVDPVSFWREVGGLRAHYQERGLLVAKDAAYLGHVLSYEQNGRFAGLTNERLRELGKELKFAPGIPAFLQRSKQLVKDDPRYARHGITVEHYVVSTGFRQMLEGSRIRPYVDGIWASEFLSDPAGPGYLDKPSGDPLTGVLSQVGYTMDSTGKTRVLFEISKGVNVEPGIDVNAKVRPEDLRVLMSDMIFIADGPSDTPAFEVVGRFGGKTFGVYTRGNFEGVRQLQDDGRVQGIAPADFRPGTPADLWLMSSMRAIADSICDRREARIGAIRNPAGHTSSLDPTPARHNGGKIAKPASEGTAAPLRRSTARG